MPVATDLHQHAWPEPFLAALSARSEGPRTVREAEGRWTLLLPGEPPYPIGEGEIDLDRRAGGLFAAAIDRALLVPPLALGLDALPAEEERRLLASWQDAALALGAPFGVWAAVASGDPRPADLRSALRRGAIGLALPAAAFADAAALERFGPVLEELARADRPLFVHPGAPAAGAEGPAPAAWWPALADYPGQLLRAWSTWLDRGADQHPTLRVAFAALAGGGPLLLERLAARGGPVELARSSRIAYETSSFGPRALAAAAQAVGTDRLAFGSDRPVVDPRQQHVPAVAGLDPQRLATVAAAQLLGEPQAAAAAPERPALTLTAPSAAQEAA
ncbi:amidohydrolase family protein [Patulibacter defluvii]|uniref:amidohydrolase family protein n=1 Tax=Patulibacter defluvii TaxID=3095358 RepID=UPI002A764DE1|nr:amidohydrolase family protein [Patulibacter sp. DM4]